MRYSPVKSMTIALVLVLTGFAAPAAADAPQVVKAELIKGADGSFTARVTIRHGDEGWKHYADKWDILAPDGTVLATRTLYHPHVNEQPFTRSLGNIKIPEKFRFIRVRPHDSRHGYGDLSKDIPVPGRWRPAKCDGDRHIEWMPGS